MSGCMSDDDLSDDSGVPYLSDDSIVNRKQKKPRKRAMISSDDDEENTESQEEGDGDVSDASSDESSRDRRKCKRKRPRSPHGFSLPSERRRKSAYAQQMSLLRERRSGRRPIRETNNNVSSPERNAVDSESDENLSEASYVQKKKRRTATLSDDGASSDDEPEYVPHDLLESDDEPEYVSNHRSESESDDEPEYVPHHQPESEDEQAHSSRSTRNESQIEEQSRVRRLRERDALFANFAARDPNSENKLILDYDIRTGRPLVSVDEALVAKLKPHQKEGVKFMWDTSFESIERLNEDRRGGGGCILAHCMGLGKTLQVITLIHTVLSHRNTNTKSVLVLCPVSTILNWVSEFKHWLTGIGDEEIEIYNLSMWKKPEERIERLETWIKKGGVMVSSYDLFRTILNNRDTPKNYRKRMQRALLDPGCDLVVCDEGHILKNDKTVLNKTLSKIRTRKRIVLSGTPLQNNLMEYFCMIDFVKPGILGSRKNFQNNFGYTITGGQFRDSVKDAVSKMKRSASNLKRISGAIIQRRDHTILDEYLPPKREHVIIVDRSNEQDELYETYVNHYSMISERHRGNKGMTLLNDYQKLRLIWSHPLAIRFGEKRKEERLKKKSRKSRRRRADEEESDGSYSQGVSDVEEIDRSYSLDRDQTDAEESEGSFADDRETTEEEMSLTEEEDTSASDTPRSESDDEEGSIRSDSSAGTEGNARVVPAENGVSARTTRLRARRLAAERNNLRVSGGHILSSDDEDREQPNQVRRVLSNDESDEDRLSITQPGSSQDTMVDPNQEERDDKDVPWGSALLPEEKLTDQSIGPKVTLLLAIIKKCEEKGDKLLVFSESLPSLDVIEHFLSVNQTEETRWEKDVDYFRLDGDVKKKEVRAKYCEIFQDRYNKRARLFLLSTKVGGLGINLTAANRVVLFDTSWNPSNDIQSIFRTYRFGQNKETFVYRLVAQATMEEIIYGRQITKLSIARRVIDEKQINRHFSREEVGDLYAFNRVGRMPYDPANGPNEDGLLADLRRQYANLIVSVHEHDSFLEENPDEELTAEERRKADEEFDHLRTAAFDETDTRSAKEKIRSALEQMISSANGFPCSESDVNALYEKVMEYYNKELEACHSGSSRGGAQGDQFTVSDFEMEERPIFDMTIRRARVQPFALDEELTIKQHALLHKLRQPGAPITWVLRCPGKSPDEMHSIFKNAFSDWWKWPVESRVGANLLLHFDWRLRRDTLEEKLLRHGIQLTRVQPGFKTAKSLLEPACGRRRGNGNGRRPRHGDDDDDNVDTGDSGTWDGADEASRGSIRQRLRSRGRSTN